MTFDGHKTASVVTGEIGIERSLIHIVSLPLSLCAARIIQNHLEQAYIELFSAHPGALREENYHLCGV